MAASKEKLPQVTKVLRQHGLGLSSSLRLASNTHSDVSKIRVIKLTSRSNSDKVKPSKNNIDNHHPPIENLNDKYKKQHQIVTPTNATIIEEVSIEEHDSEQQQTQAAPVTNVQKLKNESSLKIQNHSDFFSVPITKVNQSFTDRLASAAINDGTDNNEQHTSMIKVLNWLGHEQSKQVPATPVEQRVKEKIDNDGSIYGPPSALSMSTNNKSVLMDEKHQNSDLSAPQPINLKYHHLSLMSASVKPTDCPSSISTLRINRRTLSNINSKQLPVNVIDNKQSLKTKPWWKKSHIRCVFWHCSPLCFILLGMLLLLSLAVAITAGILVSKINHDKSIKTTDSSAGFLFTNVTTTLNNTNVNTMIMSNNSTISATTTSASLATTIVTCASGYSQAPSGACVNILIDFNNCGSFGHVCSSNYTSCSGGVCSTAPSVVLENAIPVFNFTTVDDAVVEINLPLSITMYNYSTQNVSVTSNGVVCLGGCSIAWRNGNLPSSNFSGPTAFGYWDDLYIQSQTSQNVYYAVAGTAPNRTTTFESYTTHYGYLTQYYHFQIVFYENLPNIVTSVYFQATDGGAAATIGVQKSSIGPSVSYFVNQANSVTSNLTLTFDTNLGTFTG